MGMEPSGPAYAAINGESTGSGHMGGHATVDCGAASWPITTAQLGRSGAGGAAAAGEGERAGDATEGAGAEAEVDATAAAIAGGDATCTAGGATAAVDCLAETGTSAWHANEPPAFVAYRYASVASTNMAHRKNMRG